MIPLRDHLPTRRPPIVNYALILLNVLAYLWEASVVAVGHPQIVFEWGLVPGRFSQQPMAELPHVLTSMFMHGSWLHLGGNMLFLWIFGDNVEDALGHARYLGFYLLSGLCAAASQVLIDPRSPLPMVGASGAIAGVLAGYGSLYPASPITVLNPVPLLWFVFGPVFRLPAWIVIIWFFVLNLISGLSGLATIGGTRAGGVAFFAHIGGFVAGLVLVRMLFDRGAEHIRALRAQWQPPPRMRIERSDWRYPPRPS